MFIKIVGYLRLCLMPSFALGITWAIFPSSSHSAQLCTYESAQYLGNHPKEKEPGWHRDAQGLTHGEGPNDQYWYIAQESPDRIYRIPFGRNLAEDIECNDPGVKCVYLRDEPRLTDPGYNHFGDPDYFDPDPSDEEGGYIFMPVEGFASNATGAIAVYSTPNLEFLGVTEAHLSTDAPSDTPKRHMPWAAFDDAGYLYTSEAGSTIPDIDTPRKINRWRVAWNILDNPNDFRNFLFPAGQVELLWQLPPNYPYRLFCYPYNAGDSQCLGNNVFTLKDRDGNVPALPDSYIPLGLNVPQGGDISDDGRLLFILNGSSSNACVIAAVDENDGKTVLSTRDSCGISVFELSSVDQPGEACSIGEGDCRAVLVDRSRNKGGGGAFNFRYKPGGSAQEEPEGLDWFDIDRPGAPTIPGFTDGVCIDSSTGAVLDPCPVSGQLHALLLDNDYVDLPGWPDDDDVYIKHYRVSQKCDTQPTQQVSIDPSFLNFDDIPVGGEAQAIIRIRNTGEGAFHIIAAGLNESESSDFSIDLSTTLAVPIDPGESIAISVVIAPTEAGRLNQTIKIETDIPQRNQIVIPLTAQAIGFPRQIERLINDFNQLIGSGALERSGPGMSSSGRLNAIRNMLSSAERLIGSGEMDAACGKLKNIFRRIDSASPPPDFAKGEETNSFSIELLALADRMKCKWTP